MKRKKMQYYWKKNKNNKDYPYSLVIGRTEWGMKKHHMNPKYHYAVPQNSRARKRCKIKSPLNGIWYFREGGKWKQTGSPAYWCET